MTIAQLQYFLTIRKYLSFSNAADELCITQSAISKQIKSLEGELNTLLFDRRTRTISLTPAGEEFVLYAEKILANYNEMMSNMKKHEPARNRPYIHCNHSRDVTIWHDFNHSRVYRNVSAYQIASD